MSDRTDVIRRAVLGRISRAGDMHIRVRDTTLESLLRAAGLEWETNMGGVDGYREIDAVALEAIAVLSSYNRGLVQLAIRMLAEGTLSEGQVAAASGLDRITIRRLVDELSI